jgi:5'-nucleotidase
MKIRSMSSFALLVAGLMAASAIAAAEHAKRAPEPKGPVKVRIVGFNDYHGNLQSPGTFGQNTGVPAASRPPVGGADYLAGYVAQTRAAHPNTVVVGAGDFIGATPLISALFFDEPSVETLNRIGVDLIAVGNHEFDKGKAELLRLQNGGCKITDGATDPNSCRGAQVGTPVPFEGARFQWLSANVIETSTGRTLLPAFEIKRFEGVKVAFIGMTLEGTPTIVTPIGVEGLEFKDEADTVNALVPKLRQRGVEAIVVLIHQGGFQSGAGNNSDINGCVGDLAGSEIANIVSRLDDEVDLVISGHTHAAYNCSANTVDNGTTPRPTGLPNKAGRRIPVTSASAFGRVLTEVDLEIHRRTRDVTAVAVTNRLVDRTNAAVTPSAEVKAIVDAYNQLQAPIANTVIGSITSDLPNVANAAGEMPAGLLIADAQLAATQPAALGGAAMAFMNPGGVRNPGFTFAGSAVGEGDGNVTYGEAFTVQPFGNSLVTMTLTGEQLKNLLEQQFVGCLGQGTQRILQPSNGLRWSWDAAAPACSKITELSYTPTDVTVVPPVVTGPAEVIVAGGVVQNPAQTYRITVNSFLASGGDGFTTLLAGTNVLGGAQDIDALVAHMAQFKAPAAPYDPALPALGKPRITRLP